MSIRNDVSLRDYFAAKVLSEVLREFNDSVNSGNPVSEDWRVGVALDAYAMADAMVAVRDGRRRRSEMSDKYPFSNHCHAVSFLCSAIKCGERYGETHDQARAQILEALSCVDREPPGLSIEDDFRRIMELANPDADKHDKLIVELKELVSWWYMKGGND